MSSSVKLSVVNEVDSKNVSSNQNSCSKNRISLTKVRSWSSLSSVSFKNTYFFADINRGSSKRVHKVGSSWRTICSKNKYGTSIVANVNTNQTLYTVFLRERNENFRFTQ